MANLQLTRTGSTSAALTVSGTVQGNATLTSDYTADGFDSFTATAWTATIPANQVTKALTLNFVRDSLVEDSESIFLVVTTPSSKGQSALITLTTDDGLILSRVVSGGVQMIGYPAVTGAVAGARVASETSNKVISYPAPNQTIYNSVADRLGMLGGAFCLVEFEVSTYGAVGTSSRFTWDAYYSSTSYLKCEYSNNVYNWTLRGGQSWYVAHPNNTAAVWQIELRGGVVNFWLNGYVVWTTTYQLDVVAGNLLHKMSSGAQGGCSVTGCKIRSGRFDWIAGVYSS